MNYNNPYQGYFSIQSAKQKKVIIKTTFKQNYSRVNFDNIPVFSTFILRFFQTIKIKVFNLLIWKFISETQKIRIHLTTFII